LLIRAGLVAAAVLGISGAGGDEEAYAAGCTEVSAAPPAADGVAGDHPAKRFYGPGEAIPGADFAHIVSDGYVVITYRNNLAARHVASLRLWIVSERAAVVAGAFDDQAEAVHAVTARRELRCSQFDLESLTIFRDDWFEQLRG